MEDNVSNNEIRKPTLQMNEYGVGGVGATYQMQEILKDAFVIKISDETVDSITSILEEAKNQPLKVVVIGNHSSLGTETFRAVLKSSLPVTMIVEDIQHEAKPTKRLGTIGVVAATLALSSCQTNKPNHDIEKLKAEPIEYNTIDAYYRGDNVNKKTRSCSNKKIKKRKKAKNGRGGKK